MVWLPPLCAQRRTKNRRSAASVTEGSTVDGFVLEIAELSGRVERLENELHQTEKDRDAQRNLKLAFKTQALRLAEALKKQSECDSPSHPVEAAGLSKRLLALQLQAREQGWSIQSSEVELKEELGKGTTSVTFKAAWQGLDVAVKCIKPASFGGDTESVDGFCQEVEILSRQRHPYVLQLLAASLEPPEGAWIVTEYFPLTLMQWLHGQKKRQRIRTNLLPPLGTRLKIAHELALGMQYLHGLRPRVIHRDLKPSNIFLDEYLHPRIADFGFGRSLLHGEKSLSGEIGTYIYMAPEVLRHEPYNESCDVFSFAVILCELLTGEPPYIQLSCKPAEVAFGVAYKNLRPELPRGSELADIIMSAWQEDPHKRPSFAEIASRLKCLLV